MKITGKGNFGVFRAGTLIVAALLLLLSPTDGRALTVCTKTATEICNPSTGTPSTAADCDWDGFTDYDECNGFTTVGSAYTDPLTNTTTQPAPAPINGWKATVTDPALARKDYLDPATQDLFVALSPAPDSDTRNGGSKFIYVDLSIYDAGLGITTHVVSPRAIGLDRIVKSGNVQKAVKFTEDLDTTWFAGVQLGNCIQGTPNGQDGCTVWSNRIYLDVQNNCAKINNSPAGSTTGVCKSADGTTTGVSALQVLYLKNVVAHEAGHTSNLTPTSSRKYGFHYAPESGVVEEKSIKVDALNFQPHVVYFISTAYGATDKTNAKLR